MDIPPQLLALGLGSIPWLREQVSAILAKRKADADAAKAGADAGVVNAETVREAFAEVRRELATERQAREHLRLQFEAEVELRTAAIAAVEECERRGRERDGEYARQKAALDKVIDGLQKEVADLRRTISTGRMGAA